MSKDSDAVILVAYTQPTLDPIYVYKDRARKANAAPLMEVPATSPISEKIGDDVDDGKGGGNGNGLDITNSEHTKHGSFIEQEKAPSAPPEPSRYFTGKKLLLVHSAMLLSCVFPKFFLPQ